MGFSQNIRIDLNAWKEQLEKEIEECTSKPYCTTCTTARKQIKKIETCLVILYEI
jgi:hypothetical protein